MRRLFLILLLLLALPAAALDVPRPEGYVTDRAGLLSADTEQKLERFLEEFERSDSTQLTVLTVPSLDGEALEDYALRVAESWKIGQKGTDNGALLLVAKADKKMRIEVGRGLEGRLTDLLAGRILDNELRPRFKAGDFDGGIAAGVVGMAQAVRGEYKGSGKTAGSRKGQSVPWWIFPLIFFVLPLLMRVASPAAATSHHRRGGGGFWIGGPPMGGGGFGGGGGGGFSGGGGGFSGGGSSGSW